MTLAIRFEFDAVSDAINDLRQVQNALTHRHGDAFRRLDREIEALIEGGAGTPEIVDLGAGFHIVQPPPGVSRMLRRARALGVI